LLERAGREPRLGTIAKLAGSLGTTPAVLCEGITWSAEKTRYEVKPPPPAEPKPRSASRGK